MLIDELSLQRCCALHDRTRVLEIEGSKGDIYRVTLKPNGYKHCTCIGYSYRRHCRHITLAEHVPTCWQAHAPGALKQTLQQQVNMVCPKCGGPTELVSNDS